MNIQTRRFSEPEVFLDFSSGQRPGDYVTCHTNHGLIVEGHIDRTRSIPYGSFLEIRITQAITLGNLPVPIGSSVYIKTTWGQDTLLLSLKLANPLVSGNNSISDLDLYAQGRPANRIWTTRCSPDSNLAFQIEIDLASLQFTAYRRVPNPNNDFDNPPWVTIGAEGIPDHVMNPRQREYVDIS